LLLETISAQRALFVCCLFAALLSAAACFSRNVRQRGAFLFGLDVGGGGPKFLPARRRMGTPQIVCKSDRYVSMLLLIGSFMIERLRWRVIMADTYTKAVLTVIAAALVLLAAENLVRMAKAQIMGREQTTCGSWNNPCAVTTDPGQYPLAVRIKSN
jgi:hypothetical protein